MSHFKDIIKIGVTGGIGAGKTHLLNAFAQQNIPTYQADIRAKALYEEDSELKNWVLEQFGSQSYLPDGKLNRQFLSAQVFNNSSKLKLLNEALHPRTIQDFINWTESQSFSDNQPEIVIKEAALIFEAHAEKSLDWIIYVYAPMEVRIQRVIKRDNLTYNEVNERIKRQLPDSYKMARSHQLYKNYSSCYFDTPTAESVVQKAIQSVQELKRLK